MACGILRPGPLCTLFDEINRRPYCDECRDARKLFGDRDKKHGCYSNLLPGFSSTDVKMQLDVLIVAEAHGGADKEDEEEMFRPQKGLDHEVTWLAEYYRSKPLVKFHQQEVRHLLDELDTLHKTWVFTDLIKCYVDNRSKGNREEAIKHCSAYLKMQINLLRPRHILALGRTVSRHLGCPDLKHGDASQIA